MDSVLSVLVYTPHAKAVRSEASSNFGRLVVGYGQWTIPSRWVQCAEERAPSGAAGDRYGVGGYFWRCDFRNQVFANSIFPWNFQPLDFEPLLASVDV